MAENPEGDSPKIIIDEDWKSQVVREKEALQQKQAGAPAEPAAGEAATPLGQTTAPQHGEAPAEPARPQPSPSSTKQAAASIPPASLTLLITTLATQALMSMGLMPGPDGESVPFDADQARHMIGLLEMLETKTAGNRTSEEENLLGSALHELRMAFVHVSANQDKSGQAK